MRATAVRDGSSALGTGPIIWINSHRTLTFPFALSLNLFCTMAAQVSVDYDTFLKDRLVAADERPQWVS